MSVIKYGHELKYCLGKANVKDFFFDLAFWLLTLPFFCVIFRKYQILCSTSLDSSWWHLSSEHKALHCTRIIDDNFLRVMSHRYKKFRYRYQAGLIWYHLLRMSVGVEIIQHRSALSLISSLSLVFYSCCFWHFFFFSYLFFLIFFVLPDLVLSAQWWHRQQRNLCQNCGLISCHVFSAIST